MEWTDDAIVLSARRHGETSLVVQVLTAEHGRHAGRAHGGASRRQRPVYQPGNEVRATWRSRLAENLGTLTVELQTGRAGQWIDDPLRLAGISAACAVAEASLPERAPAPAVYRGLLALLDALEREDWGEAYVAWEIALLSELGIRARSRTLRRDRPQRPARLCVAEQRSGRQPVRGRALCRPPAAPAGFPERWGRCRGRFRVRFGSRIGGRFVARISPTGSKSAAIFSNGTSSRPTTGPCRRRANASPIRLRERARYSGFDRRCRPIHPPWVAFVPHIV